MRNLGLFLTLAVGLFISGCGTISTFQTGKTIPRGKASFGMGTSMGLFRTKSNIVGFPLELPYGALEVFAGYGLFEPIDVQIKVMGSQYTSVEDFQELGGIPLFGGGSVRLALAQERWGFPMSIAIGSGYYTGSAQSRTSDFSVDSSGNLTAAEATQKVTTTRDAVYFVNWSKDLRRWLTLYGVYKMYHRLSYNRAWDHEVLVQEEAVNDKLNGGGGGISFNVGRDANTHIMFEINAIVDTNEPDSHYQKQAGLGMSTEF
ncbi:MAG: hypothetical protein HY547_07735 [Elusimicrobia bacterium]|nr:hypothetical protein [Elusimicrobiota bacterium]